MSMPGWEFWIECTKCGLTSESYPLQVFSQTLQGHAMFPAWSAKHRCYGTVSLEMSYEQRKSIEADPNGLQSLAAELSTPTLTVGVPHGLTPVTVTPTPGCPQCGGAVSISSALDKKG
jgi:hypothetical protein